MDDSIEPNEQTDPAISASEFSNVPEEPVPPISSRFMFVDVAALRAKQLRRGARLRFQADQAHVPLKSERKAMEEVRRGLVPYTVPVVTRGSKPKED
jgi:DNA-directed RNA polymerase subunit K/omega